MKKSNKAKWQRKSWEKARTLLAWSGQEGDSGQTSKWLYKGCLDPALIQPGEGLFKKR